MHYAPTVHLYTWLLLLPATMAGCELPRQGLSLNLYLTLGGLPLSCPVSILVIVQDRLAKKNHE